LVTAAGVVTKLMHGLALHRSGPALARYMLRDVAGERSR
jgi:hypothetical protein